MQNDRYRVFLSAVTSEFLPARDAVARDLRARGLTAKVQSDFRLEDDAPTTLDKLHKYIRECDAVVAIVGKRSGSFPPPVAAAAYAEQLPAGIPAASFTQWEVFFALHYKRPLSLFVATDTFVPHEPNPPPGDDAESQRRLVDYLQDTLGRDYKHFSTVDQLRIAVLEKTWPNFAISKPRKLPYDSLGELFIGREPFVNDLKARVAQSRARNQWPKHAVCGLGGVGKTRLAVEYAWRQADDYSAVLMICADSAESLDRELKNLAGVLHANLDPATPDPDRLRLTCEWLDANPGWLLVVDNVDTETARQAVTKRFTEWAKGHVLITGRVTQWPAGVVPLDLHVLSPDDARDFLLRATDGRRRTTDADETEAAALAKDELDCLCLALEQSAAYIGERSLSFADYRTRWRENKKNVRAWADKALMHYREESAVSLSIATTWQTTFDALTPPARTLLEMLSFLAPDPLPRGLLEHPEMEKQLCAACGDEDAEIELTLAELRRFSLLLRPEHLPNHAAGQVHRLVQLITRERLTAEARRKVLQAAAVATAGYAPPAADDVRNWPILQPLDVHLQVLSQNLMSADIVEPTGDLLSIVGRFAQARGAFAEAELPLSQALALDERNFGREHPQTAVRLANLASLFKATGRPADAEPLMRRALEIDERQFGSESPEAAIDMSNLAALLHATNRPEEAEPLIQRALAIDERVLGSNHPNVAIRLNNLAQLLKASEKYEEAEPLMRRALEIDEQVYGPNHPKTALRLNNLALLLQAVGRAQDAEKLLRRALEIDERSYGHEHPTVGVRLHNLAYILITAHRQTEAEPLLRQALLIDEKILGPNHPRIAGQLNNLAGLCVETKRLTEAEPFFRRALTIYQASLGFDHPSTRNVEQNLIRLQEDIRKASP